MIISTHGPSLLTVTAHLHGRGKKSTFAFTRNPHLRLHSTGHICIRSIEARPYLVAGGLFELIFRQIHPLVNINIFFVESGTTFLVFTKSVVLLYKRALKIDIKGRKKGMG